MKIKQNNDTFYSNSKVEIIIIETDISDMFQSIYNTIKSNIQKSLKKGSSSIIDSIIDYNIGISKHSFTAGSNYIKLPQKLDHPRKGLINIKNIKDNECFK